MASVKVFNKSVIGASHIANGKPCQDYSLSYSDRYLQIAVVCDGHGGNTYFRSDVGSKLAAEITVNYLKIFANCVKSSKFIGTDFSITAKPKRNPFIDLDGNEVRFENLTDDQKLYVQQAQAYIKSDGKYPNQQNLIKELIAQICNEWRNQINAHERHNRFTKKEFSILKGSGTEKAYGCTLLAFMRTDNYWLSFQIGDGTVYCCDKSLSWKRLVPEDCECFLNYTTSLCDPNAIDEFRYSFSGLKGQPVAVMLCSDGLDGSLRTESNLQDFYEQIIGLCIDNEDVESELTSFFPILSENGNKDDISLAGIVDMTGLDSICMKKIIELKKRSRVIQNEYQSKKVEIESLEAKLDTLKMKSDRQQNIRHNKQIELDKIRQSIMTRELEISNIDKSIESTREGISSLITELDNKKSDFEKWKFTIKNEMAELESELSDSEEDNNYNEKTNNIW